MPRCIFTFYSNVDLWRNWHASFYHWVRKYVFLPLGGSKVSAPRLFFNIFAVFLLYTLITGVTNDRLSHLIFNCTLVGAELFFRKVYRTFFKHRLSESVQTFFVCLVGPVNIMLMLFGNLMGYSYGVHGLWVYLEAVGRMYTRSPAGFLLRLVLSWSFLSLVTYVSYVRDRKRCDSSKVE